MTTRAFAVKSDDLVGNVMRGDEFETQRKITRSGGPVDKGEWLMTPQTVNAYYLLVEQRDHLPGGDPAAAVLRHECG